MALRHQVLQIMPAPGWYGVFFNYLTAVHQGEPIKLSIEQLIGWALVETEDTEDDDGYTERSIEGIALHDGVPTEVGESYVKDSFLGYTQDVADLEVFRSSAERKLATALAEQERKKQNGH